MAQAWKRREQQTHVGRQSGEQADEQIGQHGVHHLPACLPALMGLHEQIVKRKIDAGTNQARAKHRGHQVHFAKQKLGHQQSHQAATADGGKFGKQRPEGFKTKPHQQDDAQGRAHTDGRHLIVRRLCARTGIQQRACQVYGGVGTVAGVIALQLRQPWCGVLLIGYVEWALG